VFSLQRENIKGKCSVFGVCGEGFQVDRAKARFQAIAAGKITKNPKGLDSRLIVSNEKQAEEPVRPVVAQSKREK